MVKHEEKTCPRCKSPFECKVGSIALCQCSGVDITDDERQHLQKIYSDCLCANCIAELRVELQNETLSNRIKKLTGER